MLFSPLFQKHEPLNTPLWILLVFLHSAFRHFQTNNPSCSLSVDNFHSFSVPEYHMGLEEYRCLARFIGVPLLFPNFLDKTTIRKLHFFIKIPLRQGLLVTLRNVAK